MIEPDQYERFFNDLTGNPPRRFQSEVAQRLRAGQSLVIRAPTGSGKTWAAVAPFLHSLASGAPLADRLIYALPLRSLASSIHATVLTAMTPASSTFGPVHSTAASRSYTPDGRYCALQIGGQADDPFFEADLTFTTIDQLLSSYLFKPVSLPERLGNINAGALPGSLIIVDELHLLDPAIALGTLIEMLDRLRGLCQFVLMTATLSESGVSTLAEFLGATPVVLAGSDLATLDLYRLRRKTWAWVDSPISAQAVCDCHGGGRSIAIVNSVAAAQSLYIEIRDRLAGSPTRCLLLHSRFFPEHRRTVEQQLAGCFGPAATDSDVVLVATQVIEAGLDISADVLHTELAPVNALVQRAGRTARYSHRNVGQVKVYDSTRLGPYRSQKLLVESTRALLSSRSLSGQIVDPDTEQAWVNAVHREQEAATLSGYRNPAPRRERVHWAMDTPGRAPLSELVRSDDSVNIIIASEPSMLNFTGRDSLGRRIGWPRLLSIPGVTLMTLSRQFDIARSFGATVARIAREGNPEAGELLFRWDPANSPRELRSGWLVALDPRFASYTPELGLQLGVSGPEVSAEYEQRPPLPSYQYTFEPWLDHACRVGRQSGAILALNSVALQRLSRSLGPIPEGLLAMLSILVGHLHDSGKLADAWQSQAWNWQVQKDRRMCLGDDEPPVRSRVPIAHTTFDSSLDRKLRWDYPFPPHAVEGAFLVSGLLDDHLRNLLSASPEAAMLSACMTTAIARHHGPHSSALRTFTLGAPNADLISQLVPDTRPDQIPSRSPSLLQTRQFRESLLRFTESGQAWPFYSFFARVLRLADQRALSE